MGLGMALANLGAIGSGYVRGDMLRKQEQRDEEDRKIKLADAAYRQTQRDQEQKLQRDLASAADPATVDVGAGGMTKPATADNSDVGQPGEPGAEAGGLIPGTLVNGQQSANPTQDAATYNAPDALRARQAAAFDANGKPAEAISLQNATMNQQAGKQKLADQAWEQKVGTAMQAGHEGLANLMTQTEAGPFAGKQVKVVPSPDGKTVNYNIVNPDGSMTPTQINFPNDQSGVIQAGYMMDKAVTPQHRMEMSIRQQELGRKEGDSDARRQLWTQQAEGVIKRLELQGQLNDAKVAAAALKAQQNGGAASREERIRWTSLFTDAGRRVGETQRALQTLQRDQDFNYRLKKNPTGPEAQQIEGLQGDLKGYKDERTMWQGLLAGSQGSGPALSDAKPSAGAGPVKISTKAERDQLAPGTSYIGPDGQRYIKK
jgi:hypothetical protein